MDVVVAGGHGQIGLKLLGLLAERGDRAHGLIRNPGHAADVEAVGAEPVLCDMEAEDDLAPSSSAPTPWCSPPARVRAAARSESGPSILAPRSS